jgi:hypothetical protein
LTLCISDQRRRVAAMAAAVVVTGISVVSSGAGESQQFRQDVAQMVLLMDGPRDTKCARRSIVKTETVESNPVVERWILDRCGKLVNYRVRYTPNPKGGTDLDVQLEK